MNEQINQIIRTITPVMVMGVTFGMVSPVMLQTRRDWNKLAERIVLTRKDISPETVAIHLADAEASIPSWYKGHQRSDAVIKQGRARKWLITTAGTAKEEAVSYAEGLANAREWAQEHASLSVSAEAALAYINALPGSIAMYGEEGERTQLVYILNNLGSWRGPEARASKDAIKRKLRSIGGHV